MRILLKIAGVEVTPARPSQATAGDCDSSPHAPPPDAMWPNKTFGAIHIHTPSPTDTSATSDPSDSKTMRPNKTNSEYI